MLLLNHHLWDDAQDGQRDKGKVMKRDKKKATYLFRE
jgi:hypothetical protein